MRVVIVPAVVFLAAMTAAATVAAQQTCLRPKWTECVAFPNGGSHTGHTDQGKAVRAEITPGPDICVSNEEEIGGHTFAHFTRNNAAWPEADWIVNVDDFCFYKN
jgi:hypothetical protein